MSTRLRKRLGRLRQSAERGQTAATDAPSISSDTSRVARDAPRVSSDTSPAAEATQAMAGQKASAEVVARCSTSGEQAPPPAVPERVARLRAAVSALRERQPPRRRNLDRRLPRADSARPTVESRHQGRADFPAKLVTTAHGDLHLAERRYAAEHAHGEAPVGRARSVCPHAVAKLALDPSLAQIEPTRLVFVDTETTGLAGGTGTLAFLVGVGWFERESFRIQQFFVDEPGAEAAVLHAVLEHLTAASGWVTYNGKTYDWPLLRNRFILNRLRPPQAAPHLDLLHCARRLWKGQLDSVRLVDVERHFLAYERVDDIDGARIPSLYFDYLQTGDLDSLTPVFEHNARDLLALAAMLGQMGHGYTAEVPDEALRERVGYARVAVRTGDWGRAQSFAQHVSAALGNTDAARAQRSQPPDNATAASNKVREAHAPRDGEQAHRGKFSPQPRMPTDALLLAAEIWRRCGAFAESARLLEAAVAQLGTSDVQTPGVHLRLAKLYEHKLKDPERALVHAECAAAAEQTVANQRRLTRLRARVS